MFKKELKQKLGPNRKHVRTDKNPNHHCSKQPGQCRTEEEIIQYAYNLSREFVKRIKHKEFYLNYALIKFSTSGLGDNSSRFLMSLKNAKEVDGKNLAFLYK